MQIFFIWIISFLIHSVNKPDLKPFRISGFAQGTTYQVTYYATDTLVYKRQTDSILTKIDSSLSIYKPYSLISRFNVAEKEVKIDGHFHAVVKRSLEIFRDTRGAFDITVKPLVQVWGFGVTHVSEVPDSAKIRSILTCVGSEKIHLNKMLLVKDKPCVQIDVNGIAQGYSVDILAGFLENKGIQNYLVELGGEIRVKGRKQPSGNLMSIGIESPPEESDKAPLEKIILLPGGAVTTSGNYRKYYQSGNKHISHLIDPESGYPVQNELISVTVWAADAITADGYDNALMGMGLDKAMSFVEKNKKIEAHFIYHKKDGLIADTASAGFYKFMK